MTIFGMTLSQIILSLYDNIQLNLGIKKFIRQTIFETRYLIDERLLFPLGSVIDRYLTARIIQHYGADYRWGDEKSQNLDKKTANFGYGLLHYALIRNFRPKRLLCVGSMYGFIPYMMAKACADNKFGHVDFVDAGFDIVDKKNNTNHFFGQGFWSKINPQKHFSYLLKQGYISIYVMTSEEFYRKHRSAYDYVYLDGDHSFKGAMRDIRMFWPGLKEGGILGIHDIHFDFKKSLKNVDEDFVRTVGKVRFEMDKVWKNLGKNPYKLDVANGYSGLGIIQKITRT